MKWSSSASLTCVYVRIMCLTRFSPDFTFFDYSQVLIMAEWTHGNPEPKSRLSSWKLWSKPKLDKNKANVSQYKWSACMIYGWLMVKRDTISQTSICHFDLYHIPPYTITTHNNQQHMLVCILGFMSFSLTLTFPGTN